MRLYIQYSLNESGKGKFLRRLIPELEKLGVHCQFEERGCDIALLIRLFRAPISRKVPKVIRMDGISLLDTPRERRKATHRILASIKQCDAVIYQSRFAQRMLRGLLGFVHASEYLIANGANPTDYSVRPVTSPYAKNVVMCAKWFSNIERKHKRLKEMVEIAYNYNRQDTGFWVLGRTAGLNPSHPRVRFVGHLNDRDLARYLKLADVMLHLAWYDWCPNSVVEALVAGVPVICANQGGTSELVGNNGWVLDIDKTIAARRIRSNVPPAFDSAKVIYALDQALSNPIRVHVPHLHIETIAKQYKKVFDEVLSGSS